MTHYKTIWYSLFLKIKISWYRSGSTFRSIPFTFSYWKRKVRNSQIVYKYTNSHSFFINVINVSSHSRSQVSHLLHKIISGTKSRTKRNFTYRHSNWDALFQGQSRYILFDLIWKKTSLWFAKIKINQMWACALGVSSMGVPRSSVTTKGNFFVTVSRAGVKPVQVMFASSAFTFHQILIQCSLEFKAIYPSTWTS